MAHDLSHRPSRDWFRASFFDARDLRAWCDEFGVPPHQVRSPTLQGGVMVVDARAYPEQAGWHKPAKAPDPGKAR